MKKLDYRPGYHQIHEAVINGDIALLRGLLESNVSPNKKTLQGETPLHLACSFNDNVDLDVRLSMVKLLCKHKARIDIQDRHGRTPLHNAICNNPEENEKLVSLLLTNGADPNIREKNGLTALHLVARATEVSDREEDIARLLLEHSAKLDAADKDNNTPLIHAVNNDNVSLVKLLLSAGAQVNLSNKIGWSALFFACSHQNVPIAELLLANGAEANLRASRRQMTALHALAASWRDVHGLGAGLASGSRSRLVADLLYRHGADLDAQDDEGMTALHLAAYTGDEQLVRCLLEYGANARLSNDLGNSALHELFASSPPGHGTERETEIAKLLVDYGADPDQPNGSGESAFHLAAWQGAWDTVYFMIARAVGLADKSQQSDKGLEGSRDWPNWDGSEPRTYEAFTHLNAAILLGDEELVDRLVQTGASLEIGNLVAKAARPLVKTPLYFAARAARCGITEILLEAGCQVNRCLLHGSTALHVAVAGGKAELVELLLRFGADVRKTNSNGRIALAGALEDCSHCLSDVVKVLVMYHAARARSDAGEMSAQEVETIYSNLWLQDFFDECTGELTLMDTAMLRESTTLSMFKLLSMDLNLLAESLESEDFRAFEIHVKRYSIYRGMLETRFRMALDRKRLLDAAVTLLNAYFESTLQRIGYKSLPNEIMRNIISNFSVRELRKLASS